jgi:hypothetical protein
MILFLLIYHAFTQFTWFLHMPYAFHILLRQNNKKSDIHNFIKFTKTQTFQHAQLHKNTSISQLIYTKTNKPNIHNIFCPTL